MPARIPLDQFDVDLTRISDFSLVFDQTPTGALLLADLVAHPLTPGSARRRLG